MQAVTAAGMARVLVQAGREGRGLKPILRDVGMKDDQGKVIEKHPVKVLAMHKGWKKIEDPDGTQGWMQANLLSDSRTALVTAGEPVALRDSPRAAGRVLWRAAPGVVGRISKCAAGWCNFDVRGREFETNL